LRKISLMKTSLAESIKEYLPTRFLPFARSSWRGAKIATVIGRSPGNLLYLNRYYRLLHLNSIQDRKPWVTFGAIDWLSKRINKDWYVFEFGSGGSTLFFSDHEVKLVSVEHDPMWYENVQAVLRNEGKLVKCDYRLACPDLCEAGTPVMPSNRYSASNADYKRYVETIDEFPDETFDLSFVDGRARMECVRQSVNKVKKGGYILLDDSYRDDYRDIFKILKDWKRRDFYGLGPYRREASQTTIWQSPKI